MRCYKSILISLLFIASCHAQSDLPGPVRSLPDEAHSISNGIGAWDKNQHYWSGFNTGTISTNLIWTLPSVDGSAGTCIGWTAAFTLGWTTCGSGGSGNLVFVTSDPSGSCTSGTSPIEYNTTSGVYSGCLSGTWVRTIYAPQGIGMYGGDLQIINSGGIGGVVGIEMNGSGVVGGIAHFYDPSGNQTTLINAGTITNSVGYSITNSGYSVGFLAPTLSATTLWTLPAADGTSGQALTTNGAGILSWSSGGGSFSCTTANNCVNLNGAQTISAIKTFSNNIIEDSYIQYYNTTAALSFSWQVGACSSGWLCFENSGSQLRAYLIDVGTNPVVGTGAGFASPSILAVSTTTDSPTLTLEEFSGQTADLFDIYTTALSSKMLYVDSTGTLNTYHTIQTLATSGGFVEGSWNNNEISLSNTSGVTGVEMNGSGVVGGVFHLYDPSGNPTLLLNQGQITNYYSVGGTLYTGLFSRGDSTNGGQLYLYQPSSGFSSVAILSSSSGGFIEEYNSSGAAINTITPTGATFNGLTLSYLSGSGCLQQSSGVITTTGAACGGSGGVSSLNSLTGSISIVGTSNQITVSPSGSSIILSFPTLIDTTTFDSGATGSTIGFENSNGSFSVNGNGTIQVSGSSSGLNIVSSTAYNSIQTSGGILACSTGSCSANPLTVGGSAIINTLGQFVGAEVLASGNVQTGGVFSILGGYFGQARTGGVALSLAGGGTCTLYFNGGILYALSGC